MNKFGGSKIRKMIKTLGYGQNEYAIKKGIPISTMSKIVNSEYPPLEVVEMVCEDSEIPLYKYFMTEDDYEKLIGVDPQWLVVAQLVEQMPEEIQVKVMENLLHTIATIELVLDIYQKRTEKPGGEHKN